MSRSIIVVLTLLSMFLSTEAFARQYQLRPEGRASVAHTRLAPVVMHRAFPPFKGQHVYRPESPLLPSLARVP